MRCAAASRRSVAALGAVLAAVLTVLLGAASAGAADRPAWDRGERLRAGLFAAQADLVLGDSERAGDRARRAADEYTSGLAAGIRATAPAIDRAVRAELRRAVAAARAGDERALAAARGGLRAELLGGAFAVTREAVARGDVETAREWLLLRDFRRATRLARPGADATLALDRLAARAAGTTPAATRVAVEKDLFDANQARLRELLDGVRDAAERGFATRAAEQSAQAQGTFEILAARYRADRGAGALRQARERLATVARLAARGTTGPSLDRAATAATATLEGFVAAPFTAAEQVRRASQLRQFLALVPVEYGRGVKDGEVRLDFELQEAITFRDGAAAAFTDLAGVLGRRDQAATRAIDGRLDRLGATLRAAARDGAVPDPPAITREAEGIQRAVDALSPPAWADAPDDADFDVVALTLDRVISAASSGQWKQAEQARIEAYALFEFGPELRLKPFDPQLSATIEGLFWFGANGQPGFAKLIDRRAPVRDLRANRREMDRQLANAQATLGDASSRTTVVTNAAIIVFREGLEGVLILAAITASFVGVRRRLRRPVLAGAVLGLLASVVTFVLAQTLLGELSRFGERLEAVVGLVAIAVLLLITNWFFHKVYWTGHIAKFHRRRRELVDAERAGFLSAQAVGLVVLGLTSVYREGFETVLFLQSLQLSAGTATVLEGAGLGLLLTLLVAVVTFALQRKLPYKKMLIVTGVLIGFVLVVMVGQTVRTMQGTGWLPITSIDVQLPYWAGIWFGVFPTVETIGAQVAAMVFVIGSYVLAQELRVKRPRRRALREQAARGGDPPTRSAVGGPPSGEPVGSATAVADSAADAARAPEPAGRH